MKQKEKFMRILFKNENNESMKKSSKKKKIHVSFQEQIQKEKHSRNLKNKTITSFF